MLDDRVQFHPLSFLTERNPDEVLVGRPDTESYAVLPADGAAVLERMTAGSTPAEAAAWYEAEYGAEIDMPDFLASLDALGFIRGQDAEVAAPERPVGLRRLGRALFSPLAFAAAAVLLGCWIAAVVVHPDLAPDPHQVFFTRSALAVELLAVFGQLPWLFLHEGGHVLAGRRLGLRSSLGVGTRLYFVVFETRMNGLLTVERRRRYLPFLAGMAVDVVAVAGLGLLALALRGPHGGQPLAGRIALAMAFPILTRLAYQFLLYLRTDIYYVIATALGCHDLHEATRAVVLGRLRRLLRRPDPVVPAELWTERDLRVARWYAPFFAASVAVLFTVGTLALVPIAVQLAQLVWHGLTGPVTSPHFWDSAVFVLLNASQVCFFAVVSLRERARRRAAGHRSAPKAGDRTAPSASSPRREWA
ncbi:hypothetical protein OG455_40150 [Kitasatospora sp. NBC_01287]|uniref:hypothetical protein n=1 Tax=Kitasatospora sp. NBC_01287 TaxID=2903573 RepID=UPI00225970DC|nr:hypothetical protein [Kitasatospora sp. NBC_01287]MCX4751649.1 hypothetical protein [Kitasatospora sp. NBC_01287]